MEFLFGTTADGWNSKESLECTYAKFVVMLLPPTGSLFLGLEINIKGDVKQSNVCNLKFKSKNTSSQQQQNGLLYL